jgi:glycosyltransferase involved in cell wall biosynthesis
LALGCKALCADIPVYKELYQNCAYFCPPTDVPQIAAALQHICTEAETPSPALVQDICAQYSYEAAAQTIIAAVAASQS